MTQERKILLIPAHFGSLDAEPVSRYFAQACEMLGRLRIDYAQTPSLADLGSIRAVEARLSSGEYDAIVIYLMTWVDPNVLVDFMNRHPHLPVIFWVADYFRSGTDKVHLGALASFLPLKGTLRELGIPCVYLYPTESTRDTAAELADMIDSAAAVGRMSRARIGMVGYTALGMYPGMVHPLQIKKLFGTEIIPLDSYTLIKRCDAILQSLDLKQKVNRCFEELTCIGNLSSADRDKCSAMTEAIRQLVAENGLSAITIRCCFEMATEYAFAPCVPLSVLSDECVTSCESDIPVTLTQLLLHYLAGKPAAYLDILIMEGSRIYGSCCGFGALAYARDKNRPVDYSQHESESTGFAYQRVMSATRYEDGEYTLARLILPGNGTPYLQVIVGENRNDYESFRELGCKEFPSIGLIVKNSTAEILEKLTSQHFALLQGNVLGKLKHFCRFLNLGLEIL